MKRIYTLLLACTLWTSVLAQAPSPLSVNLTSLYSGLNSPIGCYHAGDHRLFILEQSQGDIEIIDTLGNYIGKFLDVTGLISTGSERGLLGLAFHPNYASNGYFYVNYTNLGGNTVIARYQVSGDPNVANAGSSTILLTITQPYSNHNGGHLAFGPDGYLYIGMGDGGSGGDPQNYSQNTNSLLGKMLRIDVDNGSPYGIPPSNPFVGQAGYQPEIWALGLRNPWKWSFDRSTGDLWIADVGQNAWEEIDMEPAGSAGGSNWGWRCYEGNTAYNTAGCSAFNTYDAPVDVYSHGSPYNFCSITGGYVSRGTKYAGMQGHYFFSDYCAGKVYTLYPDGNGGYVETQVHPGVAGPVAFGENVSGQLYLVSIGGTIYKVEDACGTFDPAISSNGDGSISASPGTQYWWWKDGELMAGENGQTLTPTSSGVYYATVGNGTCTRQTNSLTWLVDGGIPGCTYPAALNYDPQAETDDGSCDFGIPGCTYPEAVNYDPAATADDGSCEFGIAGCTYPEAINFNAQATWDDGSCDFGAEGCTYVQASNYDPGALRDDGSCIFPAGTDCPVDLDGDGSVNVNDLALFIAAWGVACD